MKYEILMFVMALALGQSCNRSPQMTKSQDQTTESQQLTEINDCYSDRGDRKVITDLEVELKTVANTLILMNEHGTTRYQTCKLPDWAAENVKCKISGIVKEIFPNERRFATPLVLTSISRL